MSWDFGKVRTRLTQILWITRIFDPAHRPKGPCLVSGTLVHPAERPP